MKPESLRVGVVGAGTAGTAVAILLARQGHRVSVFERVPEPAAIGAGIVLQPTGQAVLRRLELLEPVLDAGARIDRLHCRTGEGKTVFSLDYAPVGAQCFGLGLHRGVLFETLLRAADAQPGVELRCGVDVERAVDGADEVVLRTVEGDELGPFDLVVIADGARSTLRASSGLEHRDLPYPWGALWHIAADPEQVYAGELFQVVRSTTSMLGLLPTGLGPAGDVPQVSLFWSMRADRLAEFRRGDLRTWKERVLRDDPRAEGVLATIDDADQLLFAHYRHVHMPRFHGERIVLLGDAAHSMSPQLGQGCNLALVDAAVLSDVVAGTESVAAALASYSRARRHHIAYYLWATRFLTPFFQSDRGWLGWLRNIGMPLATRVPPLRRLMCRSMAGNLRGVVRRALPLDALSEPSALPAAMEAGSG